MLDLLNGVGGLDGAHLVARVATGAFFAISGYHKLFNRERHASLVATLKSDGIPFIAVNQWFVPSIEFSAGAALIVGFLTPLAALGLACICLVACFVDGIRRIPAMKPLDKADAVDDFLYLPEVLYIGLLGYFISTGAGFVSIDTFILSHL